MKLLSIKLKTAFNSLQPFEKVQFYWSDKNDGLEPICLVGPNGSGKSNLLELVADVFYFIDSEIKGEKSRTNHSNTVELEYLMEKQGRKPTAVKIQIEKNKWTFCIKKRMNWEEISSIEEIKNFLPEKVIGYSSGMNETLSYPFSISDSVYAEEVRKAGFENPLKRIEDSRLIFVDNDLNPSILISNFLIQPKSRLKVFEDHLRVGGLEYFEIVIDFELSSKKYVKLTDEHVEILMKLKACATTYQLESFVDSNRVQYTKCDFKFVVNNATEEAFKHNFDKDAYFLFSSLRKFELLNQLKLRKRYRYVSGKGLEQIPPKVGHEDKIFRLQEIKVKLSSPKIVIPYIGISDGEHQFIQVIGSVMLFKQNNVLFLMDEPETHFNPDWRSKLVQISNELTQRRPQEMILTTHSPFIVSDCRGYNVFEFWREGDSTKFAPIGIETFGTSISIILKEVFYKRSLISDLARQEIDDALETDSVKKLQETYDELGESRERDLLLEKMNKLLISRKKAR